MTKSEAERKKVEFLLNLELNSMEYQIPSSLTFANAVSHYRDAFAPRMLRSSTFSTADGHLKNHLEADWNDVPIEHISIDSVNEWIWKKRGQGLSWVTIKNILRTMQRVLSSFSKDKKPPFSQIGLAIPERDKLQMKVNSRKHISFSWAQAEQIAEHVSKNGHAWQAPSRTVCNAVSARRRFGITIQRITGVKSRRPRLSRKDHSSGRVFRSKKQRRGWAVQKCGRV